MNDNLYSLFESRFPADRTRPLLILEDGREISYGEAEETCARYASFLAGLGLAPGDRVAVQVEKSPEALLLYLACLRAGLVYLPLNSAYQQGEVGYFLGERRARRRRRAAALAALARAARRRARASATSSRSTSTARAASSTRPPARTRASPRWRAARTTSPRSSTPRGPPGRSKGAMITHRNLASNATVLHAYWGFGPDDVLVHMLPLFHVHGLFVACHCVLMNGTAMRFHAKFDARRALEDFARSTVFMGVPTFYTRLLAEAGLDPRRLRAHAPLRLRLRAAARRDPRRVREAHAATASSSATA